MVKITEDHQSLNSIISSAFNNRESEISMITGAFNMYSFSLIKELYNDIFKKTKVEAQSKKISTAK